MQSTTKSTHHPVAMTLLTAALALAGAAAAVAASTQDAFIAENNVAMNKMMAAMEIEPSGDVDRDFTAMMIPHHQGAIDMAQAELRYGHNEQLRRIAQEIIVDQQQEIAAMNLAVDQPLPPSAPAPTQVGTPAAGADAPVPAPTPVHDHAHQHAD
jgi:hypothetical protein